MLWSFSAMGGTRNRCRFVVALLLVAGCSAVMSAQSPERSPAPGTLKVFDATLVDKSIDPCQNFYKYSCNGWFQKNPLPKDQISYGRFTELSEINRGKMRAILDSTSVDTTSRTANEQKIGDE